MKKVLLMSALLALVFSTPSCKKEDDGNCWREPNKEQLKITVLEGPTVSQPSKISIFFKVQDANNNPVGYLTEDNFVIFEKGLNDKCYTEISKFEAKRKISGREQIFNHSTILVLDLSGSVLETSLKDLQSAAVAFIEAVMPTTPDPSKQMGIWWFDGEDELHLLEPVTSDIFELRAAVNSITPNISNDNSTDLYGAVIKAADIAEDVLAGFQNQDITSAASVVLFTDGEDRADRYLKENAYAAVAGSPKEITWFSLGVGNEINATDLTKIGRNGFFQAASIAQMTAAFQQIASVVNSEANSYYFFEYCSPIRNGSKNGLIIEAFEGKEVGYLKTEFDATGFTGGCEL
jgi:uncharacterized protein YegL